jgi:hypothetical protein
MPLPVTVTVALDGTVQRGPDRTFENYIQMTATVAAAPYTCAVSASPTLSPSAALGYAVVTILGKGNLNQFYIQGGTTGDIIVFFGV